MDKKIEGLKAFLDSAHSVFHAVAYLKDILDRAGYICLEEGDEWSLVPGGKYYLTRGGSALAAFRVPQGSPGGFLMSAAHTDRPTFKVKENAELVGAYTRLAVERYGGMLIAPWLDRPLSVAGRVVVETEQGVESRLVDIDRDLLLIPNVAIHMNRKANDGYTWNPAVDTIPLMGSREAAGKFWPMIEQAAGGKLLGHDLYLYVRQPVSQWGLEGEYLSAPALDDLACAWGCAQGFLNAKESGSIPVVCLFDNEEVGSSSLQGAASNFLSSILERVCAGLGLDMHRMFSQSFLVSADNAHGLHPNHPELADSANAPVMGKGIAVKFTASQRYTSDGVTAAVFRKICAKADVPTQTYCNRADIPGGSTLGNISLTQVPVPSVDIGLPQLAMHSCYETMGTQDIIHLENAMTAYYGCTLTKTCDGSITIQ